MVCLGSESAGLGDEQFTATLSKCEALTERNLLFVYMGGGVSLSGDTLIVGSNQVRCDESF